MPNSSTSDILNDPVTKHMRRDFTQLRIGQTAGEALAELRQRQPEGRVIYFYVTDADGLLMGVVPTRRLLLSPLDKLLADIMIKHVIALPADATVLDACEFFTVHRLLAFPIVDASRRIIGVVDVELYTDELTELTDLESSARQQDLFQLIGVHLTEAQQGSPLTAFRLRFPWLLCNLAAGILAALLLGLFEEDLQNTVALALFIPVVLALAESVSIQSVSLALETLRGRSASWKLLLAKLQRELQTGALLGVACGALVALVAIAWLRQPRVALCLIVGIAGGVACAAAFGLAMPYLLRLLRRDPHFAAGPIALATADMATLLIYFNLARQLLQ